MSKIITLTKDSSGDAISKVAIVTLMYVMYKAEETLDVNKKPLNYYDGGESKIGKLWLEIWPTEFQKQSNPQFPVQVTPVWTTKLELVEAGKVEVYKLGKGSAKYFRLTSDTKTKFKAWLLAEAKKGIEGLDIRAFTTKVKALLEAEAKEERGFKSSENFGKAMKDMGI